MSIFDSLFFGMIIRLKKKKHLWFYTEILVMRVCFFTLSNDSTKHTKQTVSFVFCKTCQGNQVTVSYTPANLAFFLQMIVYMYLWYGLATDQSKCMKFIYNSNNRTSFENSYSIITLRLAFICNYQQDWTANKGCLSSSVV